MPFRCTKEFKIGLSTAWRNPKADSHCKYNHGRELIFSLTFECDELDDKDWVVDFGGLKWFKQWLEDNYDHKTLITKDDPTIVFWRNMHKIGAVDLREVDHGISCERFAQVAFNLIKNDPRIRQGVKLALVTVHESEANSATYYED